MSINNRAKRQSIHPLRSRRPVMLPNFTKSSRGRRQLAGDYYAYATGGATESSRIKIVRYVKL